MDMRTRTAAGPAMVAGLSAVMLVVGGAFQGALAATHSPALEMVEWSMVATDTARFHVRWTNPDVDTTSEPTSGSLVSQYLGAFAYDYLTIGTFEVPALAPGASLDLYLDAPSSRLPQTPAPETMPYGGPPEGWPCAPDTTWDGSVHVRWDSLGTTVSAARHIGHLLVDPGEGPSFIHLITHCGGTAPWTIEGLCAGFEATLVDEDKVTPAPNPLPAGWTGFVAVGASAGTASGLACSIKVVPGCDGSLETVEIRATTCAWPGPHAPTLQTIEWSMVAADTARFHLRWINPDSATFSEPATGSLASQYLGAFVYDYLTIGTFEVPALAPGAFLDLYYDAALSALAPVPVETMPYGGPPEGWPCQPGTAWDGSVHVRWDSLGTEAHATRHVGHLLVDPGQGPSLVHLVTQCDGTIPWTIEGLRSGFAATLLEEDRTTPAPNPLPAIWTGFVAVSAPLDAESGLACSLRVVRTCDGVAQAVEIRATTCAWPAPHAPTLEAVEWSMVATDTARFHVRWTNPDPATFSEPTSGSLVSQYLGAFAYDYLTIGTFEVPALAPGASLDLYLDAPSSRLPQTPAPETMPYGGPPEGWPCAPDTTWDGSVHVRWDSLGTTVSAARHIGHLLVDPGEGPSFIHLITHCGGTAPWTIEGLCAGFEATLVDEDKATPAPNPLPAGWTGFVSVSASAGTASGLACSIKVVPGCDGSLETVEIRATTCAWPGPHAPTLQTIEWSMVNADTARFHVRWVNPDAATASEPTSGALVSQYFGAFVYDYLTIGTFDVPALAPAGFLDLYYDAALNTLPQPVKSLPYGGPPEGWPCQPGTAWDGSVHVRWDSLGVAAHATRHVGNLLVDPGQGPSLIHATTHCTDPATWTVNGLYDGFAATLLEEDRITPAPNPLPANWTGFVAVSTPASTAGGMTCLAGVMVTCNGAQQAMEVRATTCAWPGPHAPTLETIEWSMVATDTARFHLRWVNPDAATSSEPTSGSLASQYLGAFAYDYSSIGTFEVPALEPGAFLDLYYDAALGALAPVPVETLPYGGPPEGWPCTADTTWDGSVRVHWDSLGTAVGTSRHVGSLLVDPGQAASLIHLVTQCDSAIPWTIEGLSAGFEATLVDEDRTTPAPNPLPAGWTGFAAVSASAGTASGLACSLQVVRTCDGAAQTVEIRATTCAWPVPHAPTLETIEWSMVATDTARFHLRWTNPDAATFSEPTSGSLASQYLGAFAYDYSTIGTFEVPALAPGDSLDLHYDAALSALAPVPVETLPYGGPPEGWPCTADTTWDGSVRVHWDSLGTAVGTTRHVGSLLVDPGQAASLIHLVTQCDSAIPWTIEGLSAGFEATLLEEDRTTPAPNPLPAGWTGFAAVSASAGTASGLACSLQVVRTCDGAAQAIEIRATTCAWPVPHAPTLQTIEWSMVATDTARFHLRWTNPDARTASEPTSGSLASQYLGAFAYDYLTIGTFEVPAMAPGDSLDLYYDAALGALPSAPAKTLPQGGPPSDWPCQPDTTWDGSAHVRWDSLGIEAHATRHVGGLLVDPGGGASFIHLTTHCTGTAPWTIEGLCAGFEATLVDEDKVTPAPNPLPANWTGFAAISAPLDTESGLACSLAVVVGCGGALETIEIRATACAWPNAGVPDEQPRADFGIRTVAPNPTRGNTTITFGLPRSTAVRMSLIDVSGKRVRTLLAGERAAGLQSVVWDGRAESGRPLAAGVYFLSLTAEGRTSNRTLVLLR